MERADLQERERDGRERGPEEHRLRRDLPEVLAVRQRAGEGRARAEQAQLAEHRRAVA